jgi:hypothetical protein
MLSKMKTWRNPFIPRDMDEVWHCEDSVARL